MAAVVLMLAAHRQEWHSRKNRQRGMGMPEVVRPDFPKARRLPRLREGFLDCLRGHGQVCRHPGKQPPGLRPVDRCLGLPNLRGSLQDFQRGVWHVHHLPLPSFGLLM